MKRMHDYAYEHRPSEQEQKVIYNMAALVFVLLLLILTVGLTLVAGVFGFFVGPILTFFLTWRFQEWLKAKYAERNYKRALARERV